MKQYNLFNSEFLNATKWLAAGVELITYWDREKTCSNDEICLETTPKYNERYKKDLWIQLKAALTSPKM
jgi:hypothetical protein